MKAASCDQRITKAGPPLHSASVFCMRVKGRQLHFLCIVTGNAFEPRFYGPVPCDGESCKRYLRVSDRGVLWLQAIRARTNVNCPALETGE